MHPPPKYLELFKKYIFFIFMRVSCIFTASYLYSWMLIILMWERKGLCWAGQGSGWVWTSPVCSPRSDLIITIKHSLLQIRTQIRNQQHSHRHIVKLITSLSVWNFLLSHLLKRWIFLKLYMHKTASCRGFEYHSDKENTWNQFSFLLFSGHG